MYGSLRGSHVAWMSVQVVLSHTSQVELDEFWDLFTDRSDAAEGKAGTLGNSHTERAGDMMFSNPMMANPMTNPVSAQKGVKGGAIAESAAGARNKKRPVI